MIRLIFFSLLVLSLMSACIRSEILSQATANQQEIVMVIINYVDKHTAISTSNIKVINIIQVGNYARANLIPIKPVTDPALVFLQQSPQDGWSVLSIGTAFDQVFYNQYQIPKDLQV
jgi:hypothetical protein